MIEGWADKMDEYLKRTNQDRKEMMSGFTFYGLDRVMELIQEAQQRQKKLVFFYKDDNDLRCDILSYRFE
jgi:hypothetical protein